MAILGASEDFFGLDMGSGSIRLVKISGPESKYSLDAFGSASLPEGLFLSDSELDDEKKADIIKKLVTQSGVSTKNVVSSVPAEAVFSTIITLPPMTESELQKAVKYQAEQNIPASIEEVKYDWDVIGQNETTREINVMITGAAKAKIERMVKIFEKSGLNTIALETSALAVTRSLISKPDETVMIVDMGANNTEISVIKNGILVQTRSFPSGGSAMTKAIGKKLTLDENQAEAFKIKIGLNPNKLEGQVFNAIAPTMKEIIDEILRSQKYFEEQQNSMIKKIILTGGSSKLASLPEYLKTFINIEIIEGNPWEKVSYQSSFNDKLKEIAPDFATAVGLAMRR